MLKITDVQVLNLERAIIASGFPMSSDIEIMNYTLNADQEQAWRRAVKLAHVKSGTGHDNFLSGIQVVFNVTYPQYWTPEFQRYHFAQIISSQSKMHRLCVEQSKNEFKQRFNKYVDEEIINLIYDWVEKYNNDKTYENFMKVLSNLPSGYEMSMCITTNYLQLKTIYQQRKNHKLKEDWGEFCKFIEELPYAKEFIIGNGALEVSPLPK
jgi:hypothetical protein